MEKDKDRQRQAGMTENEEQLLTRSSWVNCALRDEEAVHWVSSVAHYETLVVGN